jgi:hypothetical protein
VANADDLVISPEENLGVDRGPDMGMGVCGLSEANGARSGQSKRQM